MVVDGAGDVAALGQHELPITVDRDIRAVTVGARPGAVLRVARRPGVRTQRVCTAGGADPGDLLGAAGSGDGLLPEESGGRGRGRQGPFVGIGSAGVDDVDKGQAPGRDDILVVPDALDGRFIPVLGELGLGQTEGLLLKVDRVGLIQASDPVAAQQRSPLGADGAGDPPQEPSSSEDLSGHSVDGALR